MDIRVEGGLGGEQTEAAVCAERSRVPRSVVTVLAIEPSFLVFLRENAVDDGIDSLALREGVLPESALLGETRLLEDAP